MKLGYTNFRTYLFLINNTIMKKEVRIPDGYTSKFNALVKLLVEKLPSATQGDLARLILAGVQRPHIRLSQITCGQRNVPKHMREGIVKEMQQVFNVNPNYFHDENAGVFLNNQMFYPTMGNQEPEEEGKKKNIFTIGDIRRYREMEANYELLKVELETCKGMLKDKERL